MCDNKILLYVENNERTREKEEEKEKKTHEAHKTKVIDPVRV